MAKTPDMNKHYAILEAAKKEFERYGYAEANMDRIADQAKVVKVTVYKHFQSKQALFMELVKEYARHYTTLHEIAYDETIDFKKQLSEFVRKRLLFFIDDNYVKLSNIIFSVMFKDSEVTHSVQEIIHKVYFEAHKHLVDFFLSARNNKQIDFDDVEIVIHMFIGHAKAFAFYPQMYAIPPLTPENIDKIVESSVKVVESLYMNKNTF